MEKSKDKISEIGRSYLPSVYNATKKLYSPLSKLSEVIEPEFDRAYNKFKKTPFGNKFDKVVNISNKFVYKPLKWTSSKIKDWMIVPPSKYLFNQFKETNFYGKYLRPVANSIGKVKTTFETIKIEAKHQ